MSNNTNTVVYFDGNDGNPHSYVLSVQDWCYNRAKLNVTVTENTVSMNQGNTEAHGGQKRVVRTNCDIYVFLIAKIGYKVTYA
jgi:hypothetical protein